MVLLMKAFRIAAFGLMIATLPALAETPVEQEGPLSPCVQGSSSDSAGNSQSDPPWGIEIASSFSKQEALDEFARAKQDHSDILGDYDPIVIEVCDLNLGTDPRYSARVGMADRDAADKLCAKLQAAGGACIVLKN
jgi:SPOR domain